MKNVSIIRSINLYKDLYSNSFEKFLKIGLPLFVLLCFLMIIIGDGLANKYMGVLGFLFFGALAIGNFYGGKYKPGKSFFLCRFSKRNMWRISIYGAIVSILLSLIYVILDGFSRNSILHMWPLLSLPFVLYYLHKSYSFHEDVDYVTNMEVSELLGMEIDENIQASYENFNSTGLITYGSNMMVLTDKKIIFAFYNGVKWEMANKKINDIVAVGYIASKAKHYLKIEFFDKTTIGLHMGLYDKFTSNPDLFFRKFLLVLDAALLGKTDRIIASRRRISVNNKPKPSVNVNNEGIKVRTIDISDTILGSLREATAVEPGRTLEL